MTKPTDSEGLTEDARKELAEAVRIVKEDRMWQKLNSLSPPTPKPEDKPPAPKPDDKPPAPKPEDKPPADPPPPKDPANEPPKRSGLWWGDRLTDDD